MKYNNEELELLNAIESDSIEKVYFDNDKIKLMATDTLDYLKQKKQISINMKQSDIVVAGYITGALLFALKVKVDEPLHHNPR